MKTRLLPLLFLALFMSTTNFAQTSASTAGIAVQGIARDGNNTARANTSISLTFEIYHLVASVEEQISIETRTLTTDVFGVFSHVIDPTADNNANFSNYQAYLRISEGATIISDEKLKHVPYAIAANNGVPTGSIMPFAGSSIPPGWVLCDGRVLTSITGSEALIAVLGSDNAPNLQGMFLRGAGTSPVNGQNGPDLRDTQNDTFESHLHSSGTLQNSTDGQHSHENGDHDMLMNDNGMNTSAGGTDNSDDNAGQPNLTISEPLLANGNHSHTISGSTATTGNSETRPVNYGVYYIIKL